MSSHPKLLLDTNVLLNKDFIMWTQENYHGKLETSVISYMEFERQMIARGKSDTARAILAKSNISIVNFDPIMAKAAAEIMANREDLRCDKCKNIDWADTMIYSSIGNAPTILVTSNLKDFPYDRVMSPQDVIQKYS